MYRKAHPLFLICNTPTHVGSGSDLGIVDLPIQREKHTSFPKFESSSIKGSLREACERSVGTKSFLSPEARDTMIHRLFGYDESGLSDREKDALKKHFRKEKDKPGKQEQTSFAGALGFTDARLLLFPVKSMKGVFAWVTCLKLLQQFESDMKLTDSSFEIKNLSALKPNVCYLFSSDSSLKIKPQTSKIVLEEYTFDIENTLAGVIKVNQNGAPVDLPDWLARQLFGNDGSYWCEKLKKDIVVLPEDDFKDFVNLSTEVITRTKIDNNTGTVAHGALFTEEYLPAESIMYTLVLTAAEFREKSDSGSSADPIGEDQVFSFFKEVLPDVVQMGGNATLGKGIVTTKLQKGGIHE